ncbi:hypothetical protein K431DRAFT_215625 [Polychaeton citri CBS 116435]|uniref:Uncharacterized protein n=1 Tax=Polychaeton citri CBS 116435 TaxID=1314669 RepID=A0A9P4QIG0_9PEZI|nr:hypothetical protein K431DRAFT_215625 [Polychaeton citri CBS 116435]
MAAASSQPVAQPPAREAFDPIDTAFDPSKHSAKDEIVVESPSLSSSNVLARFEFEPGRSKEGTKVLMLEWEDDEQSKTLRDDWEITWDGKRTTLPAKDQVDTEAINRLYFLLGPGVPIPTQVVLKKGSLMWRTHPLPAIFSPELGATATQSGKKGVLHTIWAKKRLQVLQQEIEREEKDNAEGVGLDMAHAEKEWIEQNFGVTSRPVGLNISTSAAATGPGAANVLNTPASPRSPGGGRLMDKLRGLRLDIKGGSETFGSSTLLTTSGAPFHNPLSPESSDVAYGSFGSFAALKDAGGMGSLNAFASAPAPAPVPAVAGGAVDEDREDDLFALPMSPRSPEMTKSPFSMLKG